jgi:hypothetical protein
MRTIKIVSLLLFIGLISCNKEKIDGKIKTDPQLAAELKSSPENIVLGNNQYSLTTYLWRDFMPSPEGNGSPMICINSLIEKDSLPIAHPIELKKQFVIKGNEIWTADYSEIKNPNDFTIEGVVREGPKWGPHINVDVVCEFEISGTTYRVLAKSQEINKTS